MLRGTELLVGFMEDAMLVLNILKNPVFILLLCFLAPWFPIPSPDYVRFAFLPALIMNLKNNMRSMLDTQSGRVAFTSDVWTSKQTQAYVCLTAHFITPAFTSERFLLDIIHLECIQMVGNQTI